MEYVPYTIKWLELILRWGHVLFAILWVGNSFLFNYLDNKLNKDISSEDIDGEGYLMHSGYYYKLLRLKKSPPSQYLNNLVIFKWQSYLTFVTGILLLIIIYYYNSGVLMVDKRVLEISPLNAILISISNPLMLSKINPPGNCGSDIFIADGQCLGNYMNYGGPSLGIMSVKNKFIRKIPGRIYQRLKKMSKKFYQFIYTHNLMMKIQKKYVQIQ